MKYSKKYSRTSSRRSKKYSGRTSISSHNSSNTSNTSIAINISNRLKQSPKLQNNENISVLEELFKCATYAEIKNILTKFYSNSIVDDERITTLKTALVSLDKKGKSGGIIGYKPENPDAIIKYFTRSLYVDEIFEIADCLKISNTFNEIFINFLITNISKIIELSAFQTKKIKQHTMPLLDYGISPSKGSFISIPLIGLNKLGQSRITNLRELLELNHIKIIPTLNVSLLVKYDKWMSKQIKSYFYAIKLLQKHLHYVNTDVKLTNVFIRENKQKHQPLETTGIITNFDLILSDLEKSTIIINGLKITTSPRSPLKIKLAYLIGKGLIYDIRYNCGDKLNTCRKINTLDIDLITFIIDYYAFMIRMDSLFITRMPHIYNTFAKFIGPNILDKIKLVLEAGKYNIDKNYSYIIGNILQEIC